jgi:RNA polymerase sigma-70 factor (ECF subfamily)
MADSSMQTVEMLKWLDRMRAGESAARDELFRGFHARLEVLARKMLGRNPRVARWVEAEDLLQNALIRLLRALECVRPDSTRRFLGLAAEQMRRELLDMARHYYGPHGVGANHESVRLGPGDGRPGIEPPDVADAPDLERWTEFHEMVERLPEREREVVGLIFYHGWAQTQVADVLDVDPRTVRRLWERALVHLHGALGNHPQEQSVAVVPDRDGPRSGSGGDGQGD